MPATEPDLHLLEMGTVWRQAHSQSCLGRVLSLSESGDGLV